MTRLSDRTGYGTNYIGVNGGHAVVRQLHQLSKDVLCGSTAGMVGRYGMFWKMVPHRLLRTKKLKRPRTPVGLAT